jgi:hypothetical protein
VSGHSSYEDSPSARNDRRVRTRTSSRDIFQAFVSNIKYAVYTNVLKLAIKACLVDRGANGCIIGRDMTVLSRTNRFIDLTGIEDHTVRELNIVHAACVMMTHIGRAICHIPQGAYMPDGKSILSPLQMEANRCTVNDKARGLNNGEQPYIQSSNGYRVPLSMQNGLMYVEVRPVRDDEWDTLPHVYLTADRDWDPTVYDHGVNKDWADSISRDPVNHHYEDLPYDRFGDLKEDVDKLGRETTRSELEAHVTESIADELVGSVIEYEVDGTIFHRDVDSEDEELDWGEWESNAQWHSYDVEGRRRSPRIRPTIDYSDTQKRNHGKKKQRDGETTVTAPTVGTDESDSDGESETPRTDYNNPAKSTLQEDEVPLRGGPLVGKPSRIDHEQYQRHFCGVPVEVIKKTFENTTQMGRKAAVKGVKLWKQHKAPNPALNIPRRNESVATDTIYGPGCPAVDDGSTAAQLFIGRKSGFSAPEGLGHTDKRYPSALMNHIRKYGAMDQIISDNAKAQISRRVEEILNMLQIKDHTSEPHNKNLNFAERVWRDIKRGTETTLNFSNAPQYTWLLALEYVCFVKNHTAHERLGWRTPTEWLLGYTPDITVLLAFVFWEPVYYALNEASFPADTSEGLGRFVGIADTVGNAITFKILTENMKVISRSVVRTATKGGVYQNLRANAAAPTLAPKPANVALKVDGKTQPVVVETVEDGDEGDTKERSPPEGTPPTRPEDSTGQPPESETFLKSAMEDAMNSGADLPTIDIGSILGRTFITSPDADGEQKRAIIESVEFLQDRTSDQMEPLLRFKARAGEDRFEEILTYNRMLQWCDQDKDKGDFFRLLSIKGHRKCPEAAGGYQVNVLWASGLADWRDINSIWEGDPVTLSLYAKLNGLLDTDGWRRCKRFAKREKVIGRMVNQVRLKNFRNRPRYKYGYQVPRNHDEAVLIDEREGNTKWQDSEDLEIYQLMEYNTFDILDAGSSVPHGYTKIPCHMVYDVKFDGRHKSRFVAGGHRTDTPIESTYSGVVSLLGVRTVTFLAELNELELWSTDIGNAYLESYTSEKVAFVAGGEFGEHAGRVMIIRKALYGLKSSGKCWHDRLYDVLQSMGFHPSKAEADIWMRDVDDHYEYIAVYVDDLMIASKDPQAIIDGLQAKPHSFKLKGTGPVEFHLGCDYWRDEDGTLCVGPRKYIDRMEAAYRTHFGSAPSQKVQSPLEKGDHPELDDSPLLDGDGMAKYQSLIGTLQWTITLGRFDIATAVMTMSGFRAAPREGHLDRVKRICGYLAKFRNACIRIRTEIPDYSDLPKKDYDWARTIYGEVRERRPHDAPPPKGKKVVTTTYKDANLYHDLATGRAVTGVLHFLNQTPIDWFTKKQETVETATYGSEFAAARTAIQQIAAMRVMLQYLGVPISESSYLFGDNESVVKSGSIPHSTLSKRHHALAYHYTREAVASKMVDFHHIPGDINPSDILSKHWGHSQVYPMLRPLLFYKGDTLELIELEG